ncbi:MAG: menaquinone biosynthesis protein [Thermoguttaceae bacterium]|jgi:chorismate dehydratase
MKRYNNRREMKMEMNHPDSPRRVIRVGAVQYLNARPLTYCLAEFAPRAELVFDVPSRLADALKTGELDVAMIPSIEYFRVPGYTIISDACIACRGPVRSVKLFSRVPMESIRTLALDEGSRTSAALVRILLKDEFGLDPELRSLPIGESPADSQAESLLVIGDRGIAANNGRFEYVWDLGERWAQSTGLPFVFAMWIARPGVDLRGFDAQLSWARDEGVKRIAEIARLEAADGWISVQDCLVYLRDHLHFYLGREEQLGLELFYQRAERHGLVPSGAKIEHYHR